MSDKPSSSLAIENPIGVAVNIDELSNRNEKSEPNNYAAKTEDLKPLDPGPMVDDQSVVLSGKKLALVFIGLSLALFLAALDQTIVSTCLPRIASEFKALDQIPWVGTSFLLTATGFAPQYGKFSDIFGRKPVFLFAVVLFLIGSALCGAAQNMTMLIYVRGLAGIGGAGIISMVMIIVTDIVSVRERGKYQGIVGAVFALASVVGPLVGGAFTDNLSWRWAFYVNLPLGVITIVCVSFWLHLPPVTGSWTAKLKRIDYLGSFLTLAAIVCILLPTNWGGTPQHPWKSTEIYVLYIVGGLLTIALIYVELKVAPEPVIEPQLFKNRAVVASFATNFFVGMCFFGLVFYTPVYFQVVRGDSATASGLELLPLIAGVMIFSIVSGIGITLSGRTREFIWVGLVILPIGCGLMTLLDAESNRGKQIGYLLVAGSGVGLSIQSSLLSAQAAVEYADVAITTAMCIFWRIMGGIFGVSIQGAVFTNVLTNNLNDVAARNDLQFPIASAENNLQFIWNIPVASIRIQIINAFVGALQSVSRVAIALACAGLIASLFIKHHKLKKTIGMLADS